MGKIITTITCIAGVLFVALFFFPIFGIMFLLFGVAVICIPIFGFSKASKLAKKAPRKPEPVTNQMPPLRYFEKIPISDVVASRNDLFPFAVIQDGMSYEEAFKKYYSDKDIYFTWDFQVENISFDVGYEKIDIYGDGILLGVAHKKSFSGTDFDRLLFHINKKTPEYKCVIGKMGKYFNVSESEYYNTPFFNPDTDDIFNKGFAKYEQHPTITIKAFYEGSIEGEEQAFSEFTDRILNDRG